MAWRARDFMAPGPNGPTKVRFSAAIEVLADISRTRRDFAL